MTQTMVQLKDIEQEYANEISRVAEVETELTADSIIELSEKLYGNIKTKDSLSDVDGDMLLFQYGIFNWGDELGEHFSFNITRQFINEDDDMYQLSLTLVFDPIKFKEVESYNSWSSDFANIDDWVKNIKTTQGYEIAKLQPIKSYELAFNEQ